MLIDFTVKNHRSIKEPITLSLEAAGAKGKSYNFFDKELANGKSIRLLKSAVIYGANASGKSNLIDAYLTFRNFIRLSTDLKLNEGISYYDPFLLDKEWLGKPTEFTVNFVGRDNIKYCYSISYSDKEVLFEQLDFYPKGYKANLFIRKGSQVEPGDNFRDKKISWKIIPERLFLSQSANEGHEQMGEIYTYFAKDVSVWNVAHKYTLEHLRKSLTDWLVNPDNSEWIQKLNKLIRIADTQITQLGTSDDHKDPYPDLSELVIHFEPQTFKRVKSVHKLFKGQKEVAIESFDFEDRESEGTKALFAIGGLVIDILARGNEVWFDELDNSLHPYLCRFLVNLFHHPVSNPNNAQLIFATHETTLLDRNNFRKDQIWITEKNKFGATQLFCVNDLEGIRDNLPFDKWYLSGKFGGLPKIKEIEFIFGDSTQPSPDEKKNSEKPTL